MKTKFYKKGNKKTCTHNSDFANRRKGVKKRISKTKKKCYISIHWPNKEGAKRRIGDWISKYVIEKSNSKAAKMLEIIVAMHIFFNTNREEKISTEQHRRNWHELQRRLEFTETRIYSYWFHSGGYVRDIYGIQLKILSKCDLTDLSSRKNSFHFNLHRYIVLKIYNHMMKTISYSSCKCLQNVS